MGTDLEYRDPFSGEISTEDSVSSEKPILCAMT